MTGNTEESGLVRQLSWVHGITIMAGMMIGAGIFVITSEAAIVLPEQRNQYLIDCSHYQQY